MKRREYKPSQVVVNHSHYHTVVVEAAEDLTELLNTAELKGFDIVSILSREKEVWVVIRIQINATNIKDYQSTLEAGEESDAIQTEDPKETSERMSVHGAETQSISLGKKPGNGKRMSARSDRPASGSGSTEKSA